MVTPFSRVVMRNRCLVNDSTFWREYDVSGIIVRRMIGLKRVPITLAYFKTALSPTDSRSRRDITTWLRTILEEEVGEKVGRELVRRSIPPYLPSPLS